MIFFSITLCFVKFLDSDDQVRQTEYEKSKKLFALKARSADYEGCKKLLEVGIGLDGIFSDGSSALHFAVLNSDGERSYMFFNELLSFFPDIALKNNDGKAAVHFAARIKDQKRRIDVLIKLLMHGASLGSVDTFGKSVVDEVVSEGSRENMEFFWQRLSCVLNKELIDKAKKFAGGEAGNGLGLTEIYKLMNKKVLGYQACASLVGVEEVFMVLLGDDQEAIKDYFSKMPQARTKKSGIDWFGYTVLQVSILRGMKGTVLYLLEHDDIDVNEKNAYGCNALHAVVGSSLLSFSDKKELVDVLVMKGCTLSSQDKYGQTPLHVALRRNDLDLVKYLLNHYRSEVGLELRNVWSDRVIDIANRHWSKELIELLAVGI